MFFLHTSTIKFGRWVMLPGFTFLLLKAPGDWCKEGWLFKEVSLSTIFEKMVKIDISPGFCSKGKLF